MQQPQDKIRKTGQVIFSVLAMGLPLIKSDVTFLLLFFSTNPGAVIKNFLMIDKSMHAPNYPAANK